MKTYIIQLESHDDVTSICDKMGWAKAGRILLVWPERGRVVTRRLDLTLIQRRCSALGAQLALVTRDPQVRFHARQLLIPVFWNLKKAQNAHWRALRISRHPLIPPIETIFPANQIRDGRRILPPDALYPARPETPRQQLPPLAQVSVFTLGVLALIALAAALLPGAHLSLSPLSKTQELTIGVQADAKITSFTLSGSVPVNEATVVVEGRDQATATGNMMIPDQAAQGEVIFSNLTDQPMTIPTDTIVTTLAPASNQSVGGKSTAGEKEFIRFATTQSGILRAGVNQTVTLPVRAITLGRKGNLKSGQLQAVEGTLGAQLAVTNPSATRGGSDRSTPLPTDKDRQLLRTKLLAALEQTALREMLANLADGDVLIPGTLELSQVLEEKFEPSSDSPADQVTLNLRLEHRAQVVMAGDLHALASAALDASLPKGFVPVDGSMEIKNVGQPQASGGRNPTWSLRAQRQIRAQIAAHDAIRVSLGQTPQAAAQGMIKALPLAGSPRIALTPAWWPRLPILPMRYSVTIEE